MHLIRKYYFYKRAILTLLIVNVFLICAGVVAGFQYFETHAVGALQMALIGMGTLVFGILLPMFFTYRIQKAVKELRVQTEKMVAQWVSLWLENYRESDGEAYKDPVFWLNIILLSVETFGENIDHPAMNLFAEFAPLLRHELHRQSGRAKRPKSKTA